MEREGGCVRGVFVARVRGSSNGPYAVGESLTRLAYSLSSQYWTKSLYFTTMSPKEL